jgi:hypothetical protein
VIVKDGVALAANWADVLLAVEKVKTSAVFLTGIDA